MITCVISGGQTGADQGGVKAAHAEGYATAGWAPKGWRTDAGPAPWLADYHLQEHFSTQYAPRTIANCRMAHALIWIGNPLSPGGRLTLEYAPAARLLLPYPARVDCIEAIRTFVFAQEGTHLLIAGNRERTNPGIAGYTERVIGEGLIPF